VVEVPPRSAGTGPPYHAILEGQEAGGGGGGFDIRADCHAGTVVVTVHNAGAGPYTPDGIYFGVSADDDSTSIRSPGYTHDGDVFSGPVQRNIHLFTFGGPSERYRIEYDCRNGG
jgi:hypothetical protein